MASDGGVAERQPEGTEAPAATTAADPWADWAGAQPQAPSTMTSETVRAEEPSRPGDGDGEVAASGYQRSMWQHSEWEDSAWDRQPTWSAGEQWNHRGQWRRDPWSEERCQGWSRDRRSDDGGDDRWSDSSHRGWWDHQNGSTTSTTTPSSEWHHGRHEATPWREERRRTDVQDYVDGDWTHEGRQRMEWRPVGGNDHAEGVQLRGDGPQDNAKASG